PGARLVRDRLRRRRVRTAGRRLRGVRERRGQRDPAGGIALDVVRDSRRHPRHALVTGERVHVDDPRLAVLLDQVEAVEPKPQRLAAAERDAPYLRIHAAGPARAREAVGREALAHTVHLVADHVDLEILIAALDVLL